MKNIIVVGGGAAGMMAAITAAENGAQVILLEKNEKLGKKIYITGKGRCNVTNACDAEELFSAMVSNPRFMYSAFYGFTNHDMMDFLEKSGVRLKVERGNRVFPASDHSSDIIRALEGRLRSAGVDVRLNTQVKAISVAWTGSSSPLKSGTCESLSGRNGLLESTASPGLYEELLSDDSKAGQPSVSGVTLSDGQFLAADAVIIATGGFSYQSTGSTGDGYRFARDLGLKVTDISPGLVPLVCREAYISRMQGLSLKNVTLTIKDGKKVLYSDFGEMMFTHFGITGPLVLTAASIIGKKLSNKNLQGYIDLKPALSADQLDDRILREFSASQNKQFKNVIGVLFPASLTPEIIALGPIPGDKPIHDINREERKAFVSLIKNFPLTITGKGEFKEAIITQGGISVKEINPSTMQAKSIPGLYIAGEVLDLDAVTGGYNLQIAWSTGYLAGLSAAISD